MPKIDIFALMYDSKLCKFANEFRARWNVLKFMSISKVSWQNWAKEGVPRMSRSLSFGN